MGSKADQTRRGMEKWEHTGMPCSSYFLKTIAAALAQLRLLLEKRIPVGAVRITRVEPIGFAFGIAFFALALGPCVLLTFALVPWRRLARSLVL